MIRVLVVDDSAVVRQVLCAELSKTADIEIVGTAADPYVARDKIVALRPDVVTLDLEMPRMDGLTFLSKLMKYYPLPVIVVSSVSPQGSDTAIKALEIGAVDVVSKPGAAYSVSEIAQLLADRIRTASVARFSKPPVQQEARVRLKAPVNGMFRTTHKILAIGASTGGTEAIRTVLSELPASTPGALVVQHMPEQFTAAFARRLNDYCEIEVREAQDGDMLRPGLALIAPGNHHLCLSRNGANYLARIKEGPPVHHQRPSVDVLFHSVARVAGQNAIGVILTGMGADGAKGMKAMLEAGAKTIAQDEKSCVVFGMPKEAIRLNAANDILPLGNIAQRISELSLLTAS